MNVVISAGLVSDSGSVRTSNEDCGRIVQPGDAANLDRRGVLAVVADGMGGHSAGEIASRLAVETIHRAYFASEEEPSVALASAVAAANAAIFARASADADLHGMGTTCVALVIRGDAAHAVSVGDSRIYLARGGRIYQMTVDDSAVGDMVSRGLITRAEAKHHHDRNVILKALGTHAAVDAGAWQRPFPVRPDDVFVLCSDGLTDLVDDDEILSNASSVASAVDACRALVQLAKSRGGFDNITVAMLRVSLPDAAVVVPATREVRVTS